MRLLHTDIDCVYSSDLSRALETAEIIVNEREHTVSALATVEARACLSSTLAQGLDLSSSYHHSPSVPSAFEWIPTSR